jgi:protein TonB
MRHRSVILLPLLVLAGCGGGSGNNSSATGATRYDLPGGGFDRARFRTDTIAFCMRRARVGETPAETLSFSCGCAADRLLTGNDDALRAMVRDERLAIRRNEEALVHCMSEVDELPPPPEPAPLPPGASTDGPDAGGGVSVPAGGRARARANLASYLTADDYPAAALRNNEQGRVSFILDIGMDGRVTNCRVTQSSGSAALDSTTCRIMRSRPRFAPARDARGMAVADSTTGAVTWALPPE